MAAGQASDFGQRVIDPLRVEAAASLKERVLVAEVTMLRAAARYHDGVGDEITAAADQIATDWRDAIESTASRGDVDGLGLACAEVLQELRESLLSGAEKDGVGVERGLV